MARIAIVKKDDCSPTGCGDYLCAKLCPVNREGQDCIVPAEDKKAEIDEGLCIGCAICVNRCPFNAIDIITFHTLNAYCFKRVANFVKKVTVSSL